MLGNNPSGPGTGLVSSTVAQSPEPEAVTFVALDVILATVVCIASEASPRASCRAATAAACCIFDWCIPTAMTLMSMAIASTTTGRITANSAVTEPSVCFLYWVHGASRVGRGYASANSFPNLEAQGAFNEPFEQALNSARG